MNDKIKSTLSVSQQPTDKNYMADFTGINTDGEFINNEEAYNIIADNIDDATKKAAIIWGINLDNVNVVH